MLTTTAYGGPIQADGRSIDGAVPNAQFAVWRNGSSYSSRPIAIFGVGGGKSDRLAQFSRNVNGRYLVDCGAIEPYQCVKIGAVRQVGGIVWDIRLGWIQPGL